MEEITNTIQIDVMLETFNGSAKKGFDESTPKRRIKPAVKNLLNNIKIMIQFRNIYRRNWKKFGDTNDHRQMTRLNREICIETNKFRNLNWNNMLTIIEKSSSLFWKVSKVLKRKTSNIPILKDNSQVYFKQQKEANTLAQCFMSNHNISSRLGDTDTIFEIDNVANPIRN